MNILFISNEYPPDTGFGGIGTYSRHAAEGLALRGHNVHVICRSIDAASSTVSENGVTLHRLVPGPYPLPQGRAFFLPRQICYRMIPQSLVRLAWATTVANACSTLINKAGPFDIIEYPECGAEGTLPRRSEMS
jgi:glycogen synthase